ncbi:MAG: lysine--tRNA ligase [Candidatus Lokiarchaeota archaeon]|nr:lysine--tRNA ligase [Candidatus Lokiarchaeota archaeon]
MSERIYVHWLEEIVDKILVRNESLITLATGKTPSGQTHIGILREIIICDALRRIFEKKGKNVRFFLFLDSLDAAKRFPAYINQEFQEKHKGKPFSLIPCPFKDCGCESYAHHFGNELISTFDDFGIRTEIIWSHNLYKTKKMQEKIKISLENTDKIKKILKKYILPTLDEEKKANFIEMQKNWMPVMAICEKCDKIQHLKKDGFIKPNRILEYFKNEQKVSYICSACGYESELSIYSGRLKLNWRVDWPAKWSIYKTTCEPAGKDHSVKGGAYDTGLELCQEIFEFVGPVKVPYEWLRLGDQDMKTSKGIVFTPKKYLEVADPELYRMLILRTNPIKHISLRIEEYPQYFDYYDKMENIYFSLEDVDNEEEEKFLQYLYPLTKINTIPEVKSFKISLKLLIFLSQLQNILVTEKLYNKVKSIMEKEGLKKMISIEEFEFLLNRTENWIREVKKIIQNEKDPRKRKELTNKIDIFEIPENVDNKIIEKLDDKQLQGIKLLRKYIEDTKDLNEDLVQNKIFSMAKDNLNILPRKMFEAIYQIILGKKFGPRLGPFLTLLDKDWVLERLRV